MNPDKLNNENKRKIRRKPKLEKTTKLFILITKCLGYRFLNGKILACGIGYSNSLSLIHVSSILRHILFYILVFEIRMLLKIYDISQPDSIFFPFSVT